MTNSQRLAGVYGTLDGIRTRVPAVKGRYPRPLDDKSIKLVERAGFEPAKLSRQIYSLIPLTTRESLLFQYW